MSYSQAWLDDSSRARGVLVVANVYDVVAVGMTTLYLSTMGYMTTDGVTVFNPIISGNLKITESISLDGSASMSFGDIELHNPNGEYDSWIDTTKYRWANNSIQVYYGDPMWVCADLAAITTTFSKVFDGVIADVDSRNRASINIKVRDKLERLNTPLTEEKLGATGTWAGGQSNLESIKPLVFGDVHNMEPLLRDPSQLEYMYNNGSAEGLLEVRDNGRAVSVTNTLASGTFKLLAAPAGTITASVQGVKNSMNLATGALVAGVFSNNIANIIALIVTQYGKTTTRLATGNTELDLTNLSTFAAANTQSVGVLVSDRDNLLGVIQGIAASIGAQVRMSRIGQLMLLRLGVNTPDASVSITDSDIVAGSLSITNKAEIVGATKLAYAKNWTVQSNLTTAIIEESKTAFATEWLYSTAADGTVIANYKLEADPVAKETFLVATADAAAEATRLNNLFKVPKVVYKFTGTSRLMSLALGQGVTLTHNRFNLSNTAGQVISLSPDWSTSLIDVEVMI